MNIEKNVYKKYAQARSRKHSTPKNCAIAFAVGGLICVFGQGLFDLYEHFGAGVREAGTYVSVTLIFITALVTGLGIYDKIAKHAGAGTIVPITGFANSVVAPAIDTKAEGFILGVGAKIFTISGPVLLYGTLSGAVYGVIYYIVNLF